MKSKDVNEELIGKRCKSIFTGLMVTGVIEEINIDEHSANVKVRYDEPHNWGGEWYDCDWSFARLCDDFGSLHHLEIIDNLYETIKVKFTQSIRKIDTMFARDYEHWGTVNLKEWIDSYESPRYTQIGERSVIITSEYNMEHIKEWLSKTMPVETLESII